MKVEFLVEGTSGFHFDRAKEVFALRQAILDVKRKVEFRADQRVDQACRNPACGVARTDVKNHDPVTTLH